MIESRKRIPLHEMDNMLIITQRLPRRGKLQLSWWSIVNVEEYTIYIIHMKFIMEESCTCSSSEEGTTFIKVAHLYSTQEDNSSAFISEQETISHVSTK